MSHTLVIMGGCFVGAMVLVAVLCLAAVLCAPNEIEDIDVERL